MPTIRSALYFSRKTTCIQSKTERHYRNNPPPHWVTGENVLEIIIKIQQFVDDTTLFLKDKEDFDIAIHIFEHFATISGLPMNKQKSEAMWLGRDKHRVDEYHNQTWVKQIQIIGIHF